jgi:Bacterial TniB protein
MVLSVDLSHLREPYRPTALLSNEERIRWIHHERWILYSHADAALARLGELLQYPPRDRMPCLLLFGMTGMGKTRILQKFMRDHEPRYEQSERRTRLTVAACQMPPAPRERDFYEELLFSLGSVAIDGGLSLATLRHRARILAQQLEVRMILIDEIHSILSGTAREQRVILNSIRFLANDLQIPIVCAGTQDAKPALMTDQQLADRFEAMELPAWKDDGSFQSLLSSFAAILPLRQPSSLLDPKVRKRILSLSEGVMVRICRLLEAAAVQAIRSGTERIELATLNEELILKTLVSISDRRSRRTTSA